MVPLKGMADKNSKKKSNLVPVSNVLQALLGRGKSPLRDSFTRWKLWRYGGEIVGPSVGSMSAPVELKRGVLVIWAKSSAQMQDLHFISAAIKLKVNKFLGAPLVHSIRFTLDEGRVPQQGDVVQEFDIRSQSEIISED